jgi:hypothetical protein
MSVRNHSTSKLLHFIPPSIHMVRLVHRARTLAFSRLGSLVAFARIAAGSILRDRECDRGELGSVVCAGIFAFAIFAPGMCPCEIGVRVGNGFVVLAFGVPVCSVLLEVQCERE